MSFRRTLSMILCPEAHREADRASWLWHRLDEARWWLGKSHPEAASLAQYIIDSEQEFPACRAEWTWQAPAYTCGIHRFRDWLDSKPFATQPPEGQPDAHPHREQGQDAGGDDGHV